MRWLLLPLVVLNLCLSTVSGQSISSIRQKFKSKDYSVSWGRRPFYSINSSLEVGYGSGHGMDLKWVRFLPGKNLVTVIVFDLDEGRKIQETKWPSDDVKVNVSEGRMSLAAYRRLLNDLSVVSSAQLKPIQRNSIWGTSGDFWVASKILRGDKIEADYDWAGYSGSLDEYLYAKPRASVDLATAALKLLKFSAHELTADDRHWASDRFVNDWKKYVGRKFYWWVGERYTMLIGFIGDKSTIPVLMTIMDQFAAVPEEYKQRNSYYAINAMTKLLGKDVRDKPVEEMSIQKSINNIHKLLDSSP